MLKSFLLGASLLTVSGLSLGSVSLWIVDPMVKVFKDTQPIIQRKTIRLECASNEYEPAQIAIRSDSPLQIYGVEFNDLVKGKEKIGKENFHYNFVGYVR